MNYIQTEISGRLLEPWLQWAVNSMNYIQTEISGRLLEPWLQWAVNSMNYIQTEISGRFLEPWSSMASKVSELYTKWGLWPVVRALAFNGY